MDLTTTNPFAGATKEDIGPVHKGTYAEYLTQPANETFTEEAKPETIQQEAATEITQTVEEVQEPAKEVVVEKPIEVVSEPSKQPTPKTWEEVLLESGYDQYDIDLLKYRKEKGNVIPFLEATSIKYEDMPAQEIMRRNLQREYPNLDAEAFELLYREEVIDRYKLDPDLHEGPTAVLGKARLEKDAAKIREQFIQEQAKFRIPERQPDVEAQRQQEAIQRENEIFKQTITTNAATQNLLQNKRLVLDGGGEGMQFQFAVDNPQDVVEMLTDGKKYQQHINKPDGQPDIEKLLLMGAIARDPKKVISSLINYGKTLGTKQVITKEFENAGEKDHVAAGGEEETFAQALLRRGVHHNPAPR